MNKLGDLALTRYNICGRTFLSSLITSLGITIVVQHVQSITVIRLGDLCKLQPDMKQPWCSGPSHPKLVAIVIHPTGQCWCRGCFKMFRLGHRQASSQINNGAHHVKPLGPEPSLEKENFPFARAN